jgi:hypothetical protein
MSRVAKTLLARNESARPLTSRWRRSRSPSKLTRAHVTFVAVGRDGAPRMTQSESQSRGTAVRDFRTFALLPKRVTLVWRRPTGKGLEISPAQVFDAGSHTVEVWPLAR